MNKEDLEKLAEYENRELGWYLENRLMTEYVETWGMDRRARLDYNDKMPPRTPWPFTDAETAHRHDLNAMLVAEAELASEDDQNIAFFEWPTKGSPPKFIK